jgi:hypothetical protein
MTATLNATHDLPQTLRTATGDTSVRCPDLDCSQPAEVIDTWVWWSTDGPVPHARTRCRLGHVFTPPSDWLVPTGNGRTR